MGLSSRFKNKLNSLKSNSDNSSDSIQYYSPILNKTLLNNRFNKKATVKLSQKIKNVKSTGYNNKEHSNYKYLPPLNAKDAGRYSLKEKILKLKKHKFSLPKIDFNNRLDSTKGKIKVPSIRFSIKSSLPEVPKLPNFSKTNIPNTEIKNKIFDISKKISKKLEACYDLTIHHASLYDFRHDRVLGVDITPNCIYLCQIDALNGKRVLTSLTSICMEGKFLTQDIAEHSDQYAQSLKELVKESNIKTKNVALSIPVNNSIVKTVTIHTLKDKEIEKALKYGSLWNNIMSQDTNPDDYSIFYQVIRRNKSSQSMDVLFIATKLSDVDIYTNVVRDSGLNPVIVDVRSFAVSNAFNNKLNNPNAADANVFLEFGLEENYAMIINSGQATIKLIDIREIHRIALIEDNIDDDLIMEFAIDYSTQVRKIINKYLKENEIDEIAALFVLSSVPRVGEIIARLSELMEEYTIVECNFFDCMKINDDFTISGTSARQNLSSWAAAIGSALRKLEIFSNSTANKHYANMLPEAGEYALVKRASYGLSVIAMAVTIAVSFVGTNLTLEVNKKSEALSNKLAKYKGVKEKHALIAEGYKSLYKENHEINYVLALVKGAGESQEKIISVYKYLNLIILEDVWLREIKFKAPDKIEIVGGSNNDKSILEFIQLLNEGNQFSKVSLKGMKEIREASLHHVDVVNVKTFKLESTLNDIPVYDFNDVNLMAGDMNSGS